MAVDLSNVSQDLLDKLIEYGLGQQQFIIYVNGQGKFLQDFEEEVDMDIAILLVEDSPHFVTEPLGSGITRYRLEFDI